MTTKIILGGFLIYLPYPAWLMYTTLSHTLSNFSSQKFSNPLTHLVDIHRGTSGIDIDLRRVDIDQCPQKNTGAAQPLNIFAGTDKCKQRTTEVSCEIF